jgi:hypothetical protein
MRQCEAYVKSQAHEGWRFNAEVDKKKRAPGDQPIAWPEAEDASRESTL